MKNTRRGERITFRLNVLLGTAQRAVRAVTENVSNHGLFIRSHHGQVPNQVVRFSVFDPESNEQINLVGIVAWCQPPTDSTPDGPPGMGVSLFGNSRDVMSRWSDVVRRVKGWADQGLARAPGHRNPAPATPAPPAEASQAQAESERPRRAYTRRPAKFNVTLRPEGIAELNQFKLKDISEGGTFVLTPKLVPVGSQINLRLVHPTSNETFTIPGLVVRAIDSLDVNEKGIGIRFETDLLDWESWDAYIARNAPCLTHQETASPPRNAARPSSPARPMPRGKQSADTGGRYRDLPVYREESKTPAVGESYHEDRKTPPVGAPGAARPVPLENKTPPKGVPLFEDQRTPPVRGRSERSSPRAGLPREEKKTPSVGLPVVPKNARRDPNSVRPAGRDVRRPPGRNHPSEPD